MAMMFLSRKRNKKSRFKLFSGNPTSASWGTLIPTNVTRVVAGDDFSFQPGIGVQALPIVAPFMGSVSVKKEYFFIPDRIYNVDRQLNFQGVTDTPNTVYKPSIAPLIPFDISLAPGDKINISVSDLQTDLPLGSLGCIVGPGSLADYMGEAPGSIVTGVVDLTPYIGYVDIYYNYYLNQQYDLVPTSLAGTVSDSALEYPYYLSVFELETYLRNIKTKSIISPAIRSGSNESYSTNVTAALHAVDSSAFTWKFFTGRQSLFQRDYPLADHKVAVEQLAARHKFIDIDRVGIHGHSGGGFMSTAAICQYPDFYKAAVSCAGNHDNRIYNRWWSETHHGVKEVVSEKGDTTFVYKIATNPEIVKQLKGHLMLVHGDIDNNVHDANTIRVVNALIRANKRFEMLILPGQRHSFGDMDEYFYWRLVDFFSEHLKGQKETSVDIPRR